MVLRDLRCGQLCRLSFWSDDEAGAGEDLGYLTVQPDVARVAARRPLVHVGTVNETDALWTLAPDVDAAVYSKWMMGAEYHVTVVADRRGHLDTIAGYLQLLWQPHRDAISLPFDDVTRATVRDVLAEIAAANPRSDPLFWRYSFFRQFDIHIQV